MFSFSQNSTYLSEQEIIDLLNRVDGGFRTFEDSFFDDANKLLKPFVKQGIISFENEEEYHIKNPVTCNVCNQDFETVFAYETHYNSLHRYLCGQCKKSLPTSHLLDLHLSEYHDSFFAVQSQRKPMYACFIEECSHKSHTAEERKDHCIKFHKFPSNYRFDTGGGGGGGSGGGGSGGVSSKKDKKVGGDGDDDNHCEMEIVDDHEGNRLHDIEKKLKNFSFGHTKMKTFDMKNTKKLSISKKNDGKLRTSSPLENDETFTDLKESLP